MKTHCNVDSKEEETQTEGDKMTDFNTDLKEDRKTYRRKLNNRQIDRQR